MIKDLDANYGVETDDEKLVTPARNVITVRTITETKVEVTISSDSASARNGESRAVEAQRQTEEAEMSL